VFIDQLSYTRISKKCKNSNSSVAIKKKKSNFMWGLEHKLYGRLQE
jgi:hypothetical protein